jgi:hypothetical protein
MRYGMEPFVPYSFSILQHASTQCRQNSVHEWKVFFSFFFFSSFFTSVSWADHVMWLEAASAQDVGSGWRHRAWVYAWLGKRADGGMNG